MMHHSREDSELADLEGRQDLEGHEGRQHVQRVQPPQVALQGRHSLRPGGWRNWCRQRVCKCVPGSKRAQVGTLTAWPLPVPQHTGSKPCMQAQEHIRSATKSGGLPHRLACLWLTPAAQVPVEDSAKPGAAMAMVQKGHWCSDGPGGELVL